MFFPSKQNLLVPIFIGIILISITAIFAADDHRLEYFCGKLKAKIEMDSQFGTKCHPIIFKNLSNIYTPELINKVCSSRDLNDYGRMFLGINLFNLFKDHADVRRHWWGVNVVHINSKNWPKNIKEQYFQVWRDYAQVLIATNKKLPLKNSVNGDFVRPSRFLCGDARFSPYDREYREKFPSDLLYFLIVTIMVDNGISFPRIPVFQASFNKYFPPISALPLKSSNQNPTIFNNEAVLSHLSPYLPMRDLHRLSLVNKSVYNSVKFHRFLWKSRLLKILGRSVTPNFFITESHYRSIVMLFELHHEDFLFNQLVLRAYELAPPLGEHTIVSKQFEYSISNL